MNIAVRGIGIISALGNGAGETLAALRAGRSGIGKLTLFRSAVDVPVGEVRRDNRALGELLGIPARETPSRTALLGMIAAAQAVADAAIPPRRAWHSFRGPRSAAWTSRRISTAPSGRTTAEDACAQWRGTTAPTAPAGSRSTAASRVTRRPSARPARRPRTPSSPERCCSKTTWPTTWWPEAPTRCAASRSTDSTRSRFSTRSGAARSTPRAQG